MKKRFSLSLIICCSEDFRKKIETTIGGGDNVQSPPNELINKIKIEMATFHRSYSNNPLYHLILLISNFPLPKNYNNSVV